MDLISYIDQLLSPFVIVSGLGFIWYINKLQRELKATNELLTAKFEDMIITAREQ